MKEKRLTFTKRIFCIVLTLLTVYSIFLSSMTAYAAFDKSLATNVYKALKIDKLTSQAYSVVDYQAGTIIIESETANDKLTIGNLVKLMTLYLSFEAVADGKISMDSEIKVSKSAQNAAYGKEKVFLDYGKKEVITVKQAIEAVCVANAYDAAYCLAEIVGIYEAGFVEMMNSKAKELGLSNTCYKDSTGLLKKEDGQYSSANDIAMLSYYLVKDFPEVLEYTKVTYGHFVHTSTGQPKTEMISSNHLIRRDFYEACDGLMTAETNADKFFAQSATACIEDERQIAVVLGAKDESYRAAELRFLLEYATKNYEYTLLDSAGSFVRKINITDGKSLKIKTATSSDFYASLPTESVENVEREIVLNAEVVAPIEKGVKVGEIVYKLDDKEIGRAELVTDEAVERAGWLTRFIRKILKWLGIN